MSSNLDPGDATPSEGTAAAAANGKSAAAHVHITTPGLRIIGSDAGTEVGLKPIESEPHDKVRHERSRVDHIAMVGDLNPILIDVGAGREAVVEHVFFKGEAIRACPEDVAELDSTIPANVMVEMERSVPNGKAVIKALMDIGAPMHSQVPAGTRCRGAGGGPRG